MPWNFLPLLDELPNLLRFGAVTYLSAMAGGADLERWNTSEVGLLHILMAEGA
jgi:hypothetical protein